MKIKDLILKLQELDENMEVKVYYEYLCECGPIDTILEYNDSIHLIATENEEM